MLSFFLWTILSEICFSLSKHQLSVLILCYIAYLFNIPSFHFIYTLLFLFHLLYMFGSHIFSFFLSDNSTPHFCGKITSVSCIIQGLASSISSFKVFSNFRYDFLIFQLFKTMSMLSMYEYLHYLFVTDL